MSVSPTPRSCRRALRRARDGVGLDVDEVTVLLGTRGDDLAELCAAARVVRDAHLSAEGRPGTLTYSRNVFIPLTRLCRDRCHYCVFATTPNRLPSAFLERDEVLRIAREGAALGCKEALFTLGDTPEDRWPSAREWLAARGYESTVDYLRSCAIAVLEQTGLLPHLNPGVLSWSALQRLRPVAASMGMMLETTSTRLGERGGPHHGSPDKDPAVRLRVLADAGRVGVPFTTGLLVGIGETHAERADSLLALRGVARRYGHLQEIIIQNFRAKPGTAMRAAPDADREEFLATVAVARLLSPPSVSVQAPPNLAGDSAADLADLLAAGVDDWGGVSPLTPDHVNPERPWPEVELLREHTEAAGFRLAERLAVYPRYVRGGQAWIDPRLAAHVAALAGPDGLARPEALPVGLVWQEPDGGAGGRVDLHSEIDSVGRHADRRGDFDEVYGDWDLIRADVDATSPNRRVTRLTGAVKAALGLAESGRLLTDTDAVLALLTAEGPELAETTALADRLRREAVGDDITYVVNRNINFSNICYVGCRFCAFAQRERDADSYRLTVRQVASRAVEAAEQGATEVCLQGGIDPKMPVTGYPDLLRAIRAAVPRLHIHAFSPMEIATAAAKAGVGVRDWLIELRAAGLDSVPGTAAEILDDEVRWVLTKGKLPTATWIEVITTAHELGIPSSSTMMYGHVDHPGHWVTHLRVLADIQRATGGFTEFVPLPFVHRNAPIYLAGMARPGPTPRDNQAVIAVSRLALHGLIDNIQCSWVKLGDAATVRALRGGANDVGGTLMEETISRMAGSEHGSARSVADLRALADRAGRPARQRTTTYA